MSILIKGMEMPKSCEECPLFCDEAFGSYKCDRVKGWGDDNSRAYDCPIVEVPTLHGRLIDAERLFNIFEPITSFPEDEQIMYVEAFLTAIKQAQTIIEAEASD